MAPGFVIFFSFLYKSARIHPPPTSLNSCSPLFSCNFGKQEKGRGSIPPHWLSPGWLWLPQGRWAGDGLSAPSTRVVLAGLRAAPLARRFSSSKASLGACMSSLSKLNRVKLRLSPHCDWSACLHQHFFCTCIFNPTRPFFMLSNRGHQAAIASHLLGNWLQSLLHRFPYQTCLAPQGAPYPCTMTFQPPPARSYSQPDRHKQDLGSMGAVSDSKPFPGRRGRLLSTHLLGPVQMALQRSPCALGSP